MEGKREMKARYKELLDRSVAAMLSAIEIYNKPNFLYRTESFVILSINAWELLLKAKWLKDHDNYVASLYVRKGKRIKKTRSGNPMTFDISYLAKKLRESRVLDELAHRNLEALIELRDTVVHFYMGIPLLERRIFELGAASVKNFVRAIQDWFNYDVSKYSFYLLPFSFEPYPIGVDAITLVKSEERFLSYLHSLDPEDSNPYTPYSVTVDIKVQFVRSSVADAAKVILSNSPDAIPVRLTEEQIKERYPWDYKELTRRCKERYIDFKVNCQYHRIRRQLEDDRKFCYVRFLDPGNSRSSKKRFYNSNILQEFDKYYTKQRSV